jgi:hypothetical protein
MMSLLKMFVVVILITTAQCSFAQQASTDKQQIEAIIATYSKSVIERDSSAFYSLFIDGPVTWCGALKDNSQAREVAKKGEKVAGSNYFSSTYKGFMRSLFHFQATEDKFDNVAIAEDGAVASVMMDYSFWANNKMTNWGNKYLTLIKKDGKWKITTVIYSLELTEYYPQSSLKLRKKLRNMTL